MQTETGRIPYGAVTAKGTTPDFLLNPTTKIERNFKKFHEANPQILNALYNLAINAWGAGAERIGIGALTETLRYSAAMQKVGAEYSINNSYRALYARLLIAKWPFLSGLFELRARPSVPQYADA